MPFSLFKKKRSKESERAILVATFNANDTHVALDFARMLTDSTSHKFDVREVEEDSFHLFWVKDRDLDDDLPGVINLLKGFGSARLRLRAIANFEVKDVSL